RMFAFQRIVEGARASQLKAARNQRQSSDRDQPGCPPKTASLRADISREPLFQSTAKTCWSLQHAFVAIKRYDIARACEHGAAARAVLKMRVHRHPQRGVDFVVNVIRNLAPDLLAIHCFSIHHGLVPFQNGRRLNQPCCHPAASKSRSISRARSNLVFTDATEMPNASAVSWMLRCSMSRSTNTSRYLRSSVANAWASF